MPDRHAFLFEDTIVVINPLPGLAWVDKGESQRADAATRRHLDSLAVGAGDPERRMRLLHWFRHHIPTWHLEELALKAWIRVHHHHIGALFDPLFPHPPFLDRIEAYIESAKLHQRGALASAKFDTAIGDEIEGSDPLRDPRRVVILRRHQADAVAEADFLGALRTCRKEYFRCRGVRIFFERVMFDFPCVIDAELVGELDLIERFLKKPELVALVPRPRKLMFVENPEFHWASPARFFVSETVGLGGDGGKRLFEANMAKCSVAGVAACWLSGVSLRSAGRGDRALRHHLDQVGAIG